LPGGKRHYRITLADALSAHDRALKFGFGDLVRWFEARIRRMN